MKSCLLALLASVALTSCASLQRRPPSGAEGQVSAEQRAAMQKIGARVKGLIVWSSSRFGNHDLFTMKADGSELKQLTQGEAVDWYPRFSPDGQQILFTRSRGGWVSEQDANRPGKWDLYLMPTTGGEPRRVVENASWGIWIGPQKILFSRGTQVLTRELAGGAETLLADSAQIPALGGAELQNPHLSPDGGYLAMTLRGARRETGVLALATKTWTQTGEGCQVNWFPAGDRIYWVNPSGNGGSELFAQALKEGKPVRKLGYDELRFVDIPGPRSHEYFPQLDASGRWLVWAATQRGHDHDIADYELYLWEVGSAPSEATRLTFHSSNDRWPDLHVTP